MTGNQVMPEGTQRTQGRSAQSTNIQVAKILSDMIKTTLGPRGMDKLLVDSTGDSTVTNDGATIMGEIVIEHPVAKMMASISKSQESEIGDGTTTAVVLAGELLKSAEELIYKKIHPTVIARGYKLAAIKSKEILEEMSIELSKCGNENEVLINIAKTAMTGKGSEEAKEFMAKIVVDTVKKVADGKEVDLDNIQLVPRAGESMQETRAIQGIILDKERIHPNMPKKIENARIALIDQAIEIKSIEFDAKVNLDNPNQLQGFIDKEAEIIEGLINKLIDNKINVLLCGRAVADNAIHFLNKAGIFTVKRIDKDDMNLLAKSTEGTIVTDIKDLNESHIGKAKSVEEKLVNDSNLIFIEGCQNPKAISILVRGSTEQLASEIKRALEDAIGDIATMIRDGRAVGGAGAPEILLSRGLREYATTLKGRAQLAVNKFAEAIEIIPEALAENAGLDPIDTLTDLRASKYKFPGIDVETGNIMDSWDEGIIEPLKIKTHAVNSASEVANMILRIDDVIIINKNPNNLQQ